MNFFKLLLLSALLLASASCANKQNIELRRVESVTVDTKSHPFTVAMELEIENTLHQNLEILEASAALLPDKKIKLTLANPLTITTNQEKVSLKLFIEELNLFDVPKLLTTKNIDIEFNAIVKFGNRKPTKIKTKLPLNTQHLMQNILKNQPHDD